MRSFLLLFVGLMLIAPSVRADSDVDGVVAVVIIRDDRGSACTLAVGPVCQADANLDPSDPGNSSVNVSQRIAYVGIAPKTFQPVPQQGTNFSGNSTSIPDPFLPALTAIWNEHKPDLSRVTNASLVMNNTTLRADYYGPAAYDLAGPSDRHGLGLDYSKEGEGGIHNDSLGPVNNPSYGADTDGVWDSFPEFVCEFFGEAPECYAQAEAIRATYWNSSPQLEWGVAWYEVEAATDPMALHPPAATESAPVATTPPHPGPLESGEYFTLHSKDTTSAPSSGPQRQSDDPSPRAPRYDSAKSITQSARGGPMKIPTDPETLAKLVRFTATAILFALLLAAYSRFSSREQVLKHEGRKLTLEAIRTQPGINTSRLAFLLNIDRQTVRHHVQILERWAYITVVRGTDATRFYPKNVKPSDVPAPSLRASSSLDAVVALLRARPEGMNRDEIHVALSVIPLRTRNHAIGRLLSKGWITEVHDSRSKVPRFVLRAAAELN